MKVYYLSTTSFFQVDSCFLAELSANHSITYGVLIPKKNANYSFEEINKYCTDAKISLQAFHLKYRLRDIRLLGVFLKVIFSIKKSKPDVIYMAGIDHPLFSLLSFFLNKKITVVGIHDVEYHSNFQGTGLYKIGRAITVKIFKNYQVFSDNQKRVFNAKYKNMNVFKIPLAMSTYGARPSDIDYVANYQKIKFLFFGNILDYKGLDRLLYSANQLAKKYQNFEVVIAGRCVDWDYKYQPLIENESIIKKHIRFIGNDEVPTLFCNAHYLVLPYKDATQSGPLMIAYNYSVPVIASDVEAFNEFVKEGESGFLFNTASSDNLTALLEAALNRSYNDYLKLQTSLNQFVESTYSQKSVAQQYEKMFTEIIK